jgi:hypothetical protein
MIMGKWEDGLRKGATIVVVEVGQTLSGGGGE